MTNPGRSRDRHPSYEYLSNNWPYRRWTSVIEARFGWKSVICTDVMWSYVRLKRENSGKYPLVENAKNSRINNDFLFPAANIYSLIICTVCVLKLKLLCSSIAEISKSESVKDKKFQPVFLRIFLLPPILDNHISKTIWPIFLHFGTSISHLSALKKTWWTFNLSQFQRGKSPKHRNLHFLLVSTQYAAVFALSLHSSYKQCYPRLFIGHNNSDTNRLKSIFSDFSQFFQCLFGHLNK